MASNSCVSRLGPDLPFTGEIGRFTQGVARALRGRFDERGASVLADPQNQQVEIVLAIPDSSEPGDGGRAREFRMSVLLLVRGAQRVVPRVLVEVVRVDAAVVALETESDSDVVSLLNEVLETLETLREAASAA
jgi:hypothetical protein